MELSRQDVRDVVDTYIQAWTKQDPDLIVTIFTEDATYHERILSEPMRGLDTIRAYWEAKVCREQVNIECELLSLHVDGATAIAEWQTEFDDVVKGVRKRMREVALLEFAEPRLISSLREYWASETVEEDRRVAGNR